MISRNEARILAEEEFRRPMVDVHRLHRWDVRAVALHVLGSGDAQASRPQFLHQFRSLSDLRSDGYRSSTCATSDSPEMGGPTGSTSVPPPAATCTSQPTTTVDSSLTSSPSGRHHGEPFELVLEGPSGGKFSEGVGGERVTMDSVEFIPTLSGRVPGTGVLSHPLPL